MYLKSFYTRLVIFRSELLVAPHFWAALLGVALIPLFVAPLSGEVTKVSLVLIFAGWVLWRARKMEKLRLPGWLFILLFLFLVFVFLSALVSGQPWQAALGRSGRFNNSVGLFAAWSVLLVALTDGWMSVNSRVVLHVLVFCALAVAVFGLMQGFGVGYFAGIRDLIIPQFDRVPSFLGNPNFSAWAVACLWPAAVLLALTSQSKKGFWYGWFATVTMWSSLSVFASRGALLAAICALGLFLPFLWKRFGMKIAASSLAVLAVLVIVSGVWAFLFHPGLSAGLSAQEQNTASRLYVWSESLLMIEKSPWLGVGPGGFLSTYMRSAVDPVPQDGWFDDPHNLFLHLASTVGLPAALALASLLGLSLYAALRKSWKDDTDIVSLACLLGLAAFVVASMFNPVTASLWVILAVLVAGCVVLPDRLESSPVSTNKNLFSRIRQQILGLTGILIILVGLVWVTGDYVASLGGNYYRIGRVETAESLVGVAKQLFPAGQNARLIFAAASLKQTRDWSEARKSLMYVTAKYPQDPIVQLQAARIWWMRFERSGDEEALRMAKTLAVRALKITPRAPDPYTMLGFFALAQNEIDMARNYLEKAIMLDSDDITSWQLLAAVYQRQGEYNAVLGSLKELVRLRPFSSSYKKARDLIQSSGKVETVNLQVSGMEVFF